MWVYEGNPCHDCEERQPGCHGKCEDYQLWVEQKEKRKAEVYQKRKDMSDPDSVLHDGRRRRARKYQKKNEKLK